MSVLQGETYTQWDKRVRREIRAYNARVDDVLLPFLVETTQRSVANTWSDYEYEKLMPVFIQAIVFVLHSLWEPHLTDQQWATRLKERGWDTDFTTWDAHHTANLRQWHWATDEHSQHRRYVPIDPLRPAANYYVTMCDGQRFGQPAELTYPLSDQPPPPGAGWHVMPKPLWHEWEGRIGWWRPATKPKDYERYHRALVGLPRTLREKYQIR
jgi:hypothetical protein